MAFFTEDFLDFFIELAPNNNKEWFDANRKRYETSVKEPFKKFVQHLLDEFAKTDKAFADSEAKNSIFRINRDIRFSKDKTPYKTQVSAVISPDGKKDRTASGVYIELGPAHLRVYAGIYELDKEQLLEVREGIANNISKFQKLYTNDDFKNTFGEIRGEKNKIIPKHLKEAGEKEPLIFNKQWYYFIEFDPTTILEHNLDDIILDCSKKAAPVSKFLKSHIH